MLRAVTAVLSAVASLVVVGSLLAADGANAPKGGDRQPGPPKRDPIERMLHGITLTDAQKAKVDELKKEYGPKFKEVFGKPGDILTDEQKKARNDAMKAAKEAGKDRREVWEAGMKAVTLTPEQQKKMMENRQKSQKAMMALNKEVREKLMTILTDEQKQQLKKAARPNKHRKGPPPEGGPGPGGPPPETN